MTAALLFLLGCGVGFVFGVVTEWVAELPREHRR